MGRCVGGWMGACMDGWIADGVCFSKSQLGEPHHRSRVRVKTNKITKQTNKQTSKQTNKQTNTTSEHIKQAKQTKKANKAP